MIDDSSATPSQALQAACRFYLHDSVHSAGLKALFCEWLGQDHYGASGTMERHVPGDD